MLTKTQLLAECDRAEKARRDAGLDPADAMIQITVRSVRPKNWERVRLMRDLYGRCVGELPRGRWLIDVLARDVRRAVETGA